MKNIDNDLEKETPFKSYEENVIKSIKALKEQFIKKIRQLTGLILENEGLIANARLRIKAKFHENMEFISTMP